VGSSGDCVFDDLNLPVPGPAGQGAHPLAAHRAKPVNYRLPPRFTGYAQIKQIIAYSTEKQHGLIE
jgi:hypothetical protein